MTESSLPPEDAIMTELASLQDYLTAAKKKLEIGEIMGVDGIEDRVAQLCKNVMGAPVAQQQAYLPGLTALIEMMNQYEKDLRVRSAALSSGHPHEG